MSANPYESPEDRELLESWKEIAAYLGKSVRSVQEWEKHEGLPVHRHQHEKRGTLYAYRSELDAWLRSRAASEQAAVVDPPSAFPAPVARAAAMRSPKVVVRVAAGACIAIAAIAALRFAGASSPKAVPAPRPLAYHERLWTLVVPFENVTGEAQFNDVIGYAVERELTESRLVRIVSRQRVEDTLRLMKRPVASKLTETLAREVAIRDSGIRLLIGGRIERVDRGYVLTARLINPPDGSVIDTASVDLRSAGEVPGGLRQLSSRLRASLGESQTNIDLTTKHLEKVTTPSLNALRLYSQSVALGNRGEWLAALEFAKRAVAEDPQFASAYIWLAWAAFYTGNAQYADYADHAVQLAANASDRERYWILASYHTMRNEPEAAAANFEALLMLQPDHNLALTGIIFHDGKLGKPALATRFAIDAVEARPNDVDLNALAGWSLAAAGQNKQAQVYVDKALHLSQQQENVTINGALFWAYFFESYASWLRGDLHSSSRSLDKLVRTPAILTSDASDAAMKLAAVQYLTLNDAAGARESASRIHNDSNRHLLLALTAYAGGDVRALHEELQQIDGTEDAPLAIWMMARAGELDRAERLVRKFESRNYFQLDEVTRGLRAELALARGRTDEAIHLLDGFQKTDGGVFHRESQTLAKALLQRGKRTEALAVLRQSWEHPPDATTMSTAMFWLWSGKELAEMYRIEHREMDAIDIENRLAAFSVHDHTIVGADTPATR
jgi:tetratricopeptide (TPR) repeat protein